MLPKDATQKHINCDIVSRAVPIRSVRRAGSDQKRTKSAHAHRTYARASVLSQICWLLILQFFYTSLAHLEPISSRISFRFFTFRVGLPVDVVAVGGGGGVVVFALFFTF